jgi:SAM-dependent methyltransferase
MDRLTYRPGLHRDCAARGRCWTQLSHDWLTPFYDTLIRWTMPESTFKRELVRQAEIKPEYRMLDVGCGTATLTLLIKNAHPNVTVTGIDGDQKILQLGRKKIKEAGLGITLTQAMAFALPYSGGSFDRVLSSLMFHHLSREDKTRSFKEVYRVLRGGGELHIADFGKPHSVLMKIISFPWRLFGASSGADNLQGLLPGMMREAGFTDVREATRYMTMFGTLSLYAGRKH